MTKKFTSIKATLSQDFTISGDLDEARQEELADQFLLAANETRGSGIKFEVEDEETVETGRTAREIAEEWQGVCSEQLDDQALIDALCIFIDKQGKAARLDEFLRALADEGMSDPAAE